MKFYYHCYLCNNDFYLNCIKKCKCENCFYFKNGKIEKCNNCSKKIKIIFEDLITKSINNNILEHNILYYNESLDKFIKEIKLKIEDTKIILEKMEKELDLYESLIAKGRKFINKEAINNLKNLKIFTNIDDKKKFFHQKNG